MASDVVKVRTVGGSVIITIPKPILAHVNISDGDKVMVTSTGVNQLVVDRLIDADGTRITP